MTRGDASQRSTRQCIGRMADGSRCQRRPIPDSPGGTRHAHCDRCEARVLRESFGPVGWADRARVNELPALIVGGVPIESAYPRGAEPSVPVEFSAPREAAASIVTARTDAGTRRESLPPGRPMAQPASVRAATPTG